MSNIVADGGRVDSRFYSKNVFFDRLGEKGILVLAPHTDDESLGCGGSIARWAGEENQVHVLCFSTCHESLPHNYKGLPPPYITETELGDACDILGCTFSIHETPFDTSRNTANQY